MLQIFYFGADFGTGHAIHTDEHDENHPFTDGAAGYQNKPSSGSMRQSLTYVSIRLGIYGNDSMRDKVG